MVSSMNLPISAKYHGLYTGMKMLNYGPNQILNLNTFERYLSKLLKLDQ